MRIQCTGPDSVALLLEDDDLELHGMKPSEIDMETARSIVENALPAVGMYNCASEIQAFAGRNGVMVFAKCRYKSKLERYRLDSFETAVSAAKALPEGLRLRSSLITYRNDYYLTIIGESGDTIRAMWTLADFGARDTRGKVFEAYLYEHGRMMIRHNAIDKLKSFS